MKSTRAKPLPGSQGNSSTAFRPSRRAIMAGTPAAVMSSAATQANGSIPTHVTDDPVFAAAGKHRQAVQAWQAAPGETHEDDKISNQLLAVKRDAWRAWLTTPPTTLAGIAATLEQASESACISDSCATPPVRVKYAA